MTIYLISFPSEAMKVDPSELEAVSQAAHAVVAEAMAAGVYVFSGGIDGGVAPVLVSADGTVSDRTYAGRAVPDGGYAVLDLPTREDALEWAARLAAACRCAQEVREFMVDPELERIDPR